MVESQQADVTSSQDSRTDRAVLILADDLIWASRLRSAVERAGWLPRVRAWPGAVPAGSGAVPAEAGAAIVDLGLRRGDPIAAVAGLAGAGLSVVAVGQHDDLATRKRALAAGAYRVYSYNKLFSDGPTVLGRWLGQLGRPG